MTLVFSSTKMLMVLFFSCFVDDQLASSTALRAASSMVSSIISLCRGSGPGWPGLPRR